MLHCKSSMAEGFSGTVQTGWFIHGLLPTPNKKLSSNLLALNRARIKVVTRMLTLHDGFNDHICIMT